MSLQVLSNLHELNIIITITIILTITLITIPYLNFQVRSNLRELFLHDVSPTLDSEQLEPLRWEQIKRKRVQTKFEVQKTEAAQVRIQKIKKKIDKPQKDKFEPLRVICAAKGIKTNLGAPAPIDNR